MIHPNDRTHIMYHQPFLSEQGCILFQVAYVSMQTYLWIFMCMFNCVKDVLDMWAKVVLDKHLFHVTLEV